MLKIVNYGLGNISAFINTYKRSGVEVAAASTPSELKGASKIILPGVGAFDEAISLLNASGLRPKLEELVGQGTVPLLGICVGMQILAESSEEGRQAGLGFIKGKVKKFGGEVGERKEPPVPHMGWNTVTPREQDPLFEGLESEPRFYFLHSYYFECNESKNTLATTEYRLEFSSVVREKQVYGIQCHPEKSHSAGSVLLTNFCNLME